MSSAPDGSNAILWALEGFSNPGILHAFTTDLKEVFTSDVGAGAVKFAIPTVANGKVYVGTQNSLVIYGQLTPRPSKIIPPR